MEDLTRFTEHMWLNADEDIVTVGLTEEAAEDLTDDINLSLPEVDDHVLRGKVCGYIETESGNIDLYSPVTGTILEVNEAITDNPDLIVEDPTDEGWLFRVEADDISQIEKYSKESGFVSTDDEDDDDESEDEDEEDYNYDDSDSSEAES